MSEEYYWLYEIEVIGPHTNEFDLENKINVKRFLIEFEVEIKATKKLVHRKSKLAIGHEFFFEFTGSSSTKEQAILNSLNNGSMSVRTNSDVLSKDIKTKNFHTVFSGSFMETFDMAYGVEIMKAIRHMENPQTRNKRREYFIGEAI